MFETRNRRCRGSFVWLAVIALLAMLLIAGCGGGETSAATACSLAITVDWPAQTRLIPQASNSIRVEVSDGASFTANRLLVRPPESGITIVEIEPVPAGTLTVMATAYPGLDATGVPQGTSSLIVTTRAGERTVVPLTLDSTIDRLTLEPDAGAIDVGETLTLAATPRDAAGSVVLVPPGSITWESSGPAATVSNGVVTGISAGTVTITARESESGATGTAAMTVREIAPHPGRIAFVSDRDGTTEIYVMNADGTDPRRLTTDGMRKDEIAISPDGRKVAYAAKGTGKWQIFIVDIDGTGLRQLTNNGRDNWRPSFSPDSRTLVYFSSVSGGNDEIFTMSEDGGNQTRLTENTSMDVLPVFTPDGTKIVFGSNRSGRYQLHVMNSDGSNPQQLTFDTALKLYHDIGPDGARIATTYGGQLVADYGGSGMYGYIAGGRIATMNMDGGDLRLLTDLGADNDKPVYNPDGSKIAFSSNRDGQWEIYVMNPDGSGQTRLTNHPANDWYPAWGPAHP
ncbi:MAG: DPP IV N-terminal domain-containing protein [Armatimonadota bacterium]